MSVIMSVMNISHRHSEAKISENLVFCLVRPDRELKAGEEIDDD